MRQALKFLHIIGACGLVGALGCYIVILLFAPQSTPQAYADMRQSISSVCNYLLVPSMVVAIVSGLLSMAAYRPFQEMRWVWCKALLGFAMFEATLLAVQGKAATAAKLAGDIANGSAKPNALAEAISNEWMALYATLAISIANVVLGVWRPRLHFGQAESP